MRGKSIWSVKFSTASLVLIPAAVGINYIGKMFAQVLKLPLWLDSIGTMLASMLAGPIIGSICGAINNVIYGLTADPISFIYALTSIAIGLAIGIMAKKGMFKNFGKVIVAGLIVALVSAIVSTPINIGFWGGQTGNVWGDTLFAFLSANKFPVWISSFLDEFVVDLPDKLATLIISYGIFKGLPQKLTVLYSNDDEIETL
ncbi:ECF transporter S component [Thermoanaerobacterium sp. RBIITD]|uniref:ECF transporter S component n=1 Tax=Thermoanaerobacterium sp. RBIITD TaxID=1550240 RepID=UPI000BB690E8|nr:ECF transporter S component [Thermoanaerobacterium sp. RBIITD]SNX52975.1 energy-coupling factor transport system substrate-specific component [Thermoanaerobacterium sp. RBIITD]